MLQADSLPFEPPGKPMTKLDSILKSRDITLPAKVCIVKAMVLPEVVSGCESWTINKAVYQSTRVGYQSCLTLCDPMDYSPPGSSVHEISQARILEWVAISSSRASPNPRIKPASPVLQVDSSL